MGINTQNNYILDNEKIISNLKRIVKKMPMRLTLQDFREVGGYLLVIFTSNMKIEDKIDAHSHCVTYEELFNKEFESKYMFLLEPILRHNIDCRGRFMIKCYVPRYGLKFHFKGKNGQFTWYYALMIDKLPEIRPFISEEKNSDSRWCFWMDVFFRGSSKDRNNGFFKYPEILPFVPINPMNNTLYGTIVIPTKKDLKEIINNSERYHENDLKTYEEWRDENPPLAIDKEDYCELIEYLRYAVYVLYNKIWDVQRKKWILEPKVFRVNKFISVKLEDGSTNIYVNDKYFRQCKSLLFNLPVDHLEEYEEVKSIDDMIVEHPETIRSHMEEFSSEEEFWGHCSNLQVWAENGYDTRIIHSNLAFPLLSRLTSAGDIKAKRVFKEEIASRFEFGNESTRLLLVIEGYLNHLTKEELQLLVEKIDGFENWVCFQVLKEYSKSYIFGGLEKLEEILFLNNDAYFNLLANLADLGYSLCKKQLVEIILSLVGEIRLRVLVTTVDQYIRHFNEVDMNQLIQAINNDFASHPPKFFEFQTFQTFLKARVTIGDQRALKVLKKFLDYNNLIEKY